MLLKGVFNFSPQTTVLQAVVWVLYVGIVLTLFLRRPRCQDARPRADPLARSPHVPHPLRRRFASSPHAPPSPSSRSPVAPAQRPRRRSGAPGPITVKATDNSCDISATTAPAGTLNFSVANTGTKVTEFYVYGTGDRIMGEVENIGPGLTRELIVEVADGGTLHHRVQARHGRRRHPRPVHGHRDGRPAPATRTPSSRRPRGLQALRHVAGRGARAQDAGSSSTR